MDEPARPILTDDPPATGWGWREVGATLVFTVVAALVIGVVARGAVSALGIEAGQALVSPVVYLVGVAIYLAVIVGVYLFAARRAGWAAVGVRGASWTSFALVLPLFVIEIIALVLVNSLVGVLAGGFENPQVDALTGGEAISALELGMLFVLVAGLVPFAEELFFRGMFYPVLRRRLAPAPAILLNAALFSVAHVFVLLLPGLFVVGLLLAYLRERSGSIWPGVLLHALQNGLALLAIAVALAGGAP